MNKSPEKPWSFVEEDLPQTPFATVDDISASPAENNGISRKLSSLRPSIEWVLGLLGAGAIYAVMVLVVRPTSVMPHLLGVLALNVSAAMLLHRLQKDRGKSAERKGRDPAGGASGAESRNVSISQAGLVPILHAVEQHATNIEHRVTEVLEEHAKISLDLSLAHAQKRQVTAILEAAAEPVLAVDGSEKVIYMNHSAEELFGIQRSDTLRKPLSAVITHQPIVSMVHEACEADARAARRRHEIEWGARSLSILLSPLQLEDAEEQEAGGHNGVVVVLRDVTKDREASRHKSEFVANAAHELRTPLASIRAYMEMLVDGEAPDEKTRTEYYDIIQTSVRRLGRMIDNILNISRIEAGTVRLEKTPVAISMIVKEAVDTLRPQAETKGINLSEELAPVVDRVLGDRDLIHQAILNVVGNAIKYTPQGGQVQVKMVTLPSARRIRIEVSDTGVGIPKEDLPRMFQKFFRVEANKKIASGTGLGLNLVRQIVETVHGGEVSFSSEVNHGSTFSLSLPLYQEHDTSGATAS